MANAASFLLPVQGRKAGRGMGIRVRTPSSPGPPSKGRELFVPLAAHAHLMLESTQLLSQLWNSLKQIGDQPVVRNLEDRRFRVFVDRNDHFAVLHAGQMLDRARNAHGNVELGRDYLPGLSDLIVVGNETGIYRGTRCAHRSFQLVGELFENL